MSALTLIKSSPIVRSARRAANGFEIQPVPMTGMSRRMPRFGEAAFHGFHTCKNTLEWVFLDKGNMVHHACISLSDAL